MGQPYVLYGSYASYFTAKTRAQLRKKGIDYVERLPSAARFRAHVRPTSGSHRIPQLETPEGDVLQDSTTIFDYLESRHPEVPGLPRTPRQRLAAHLMELFGSEGLLRLAWQLRWFFPEGNEFFVKMDFGRSFRPDGTDEELLHYGNVIADRMMSRGRVEITPQAQRQLTEEYLELLRLMEAHCRLHPYMLGGHPSTADYALMGALHAHMGRDPVPLNIMQTHAPRVFRWVEHMNENQIVAPEFAERPVAFERGDRVPPTLVSLLRHLVGKYGRDMEWNARAFAAWEAQNPHTRELPPDQPQLGPVEVEWDGELRTLRCNAHEVWIMQRPLGFYAALDRDGRDAVRRLVREIGARRLLETPLPARLERVGNRLTIVR